MHFHRVNRTCGCSSKAAPWRRRRICARRGRRAGRGRRQRGQPSRRADRRQRAVHSAARRARFLGTRGRRAHVPRHGRVRRIRRTRLWPGTIPGRAIAWPAGEPICPSATSQPVAGRVTGAIGSAELVEVIAQPSCQGRSVTPGRPPQDSPARPRGGSRRVKVGARDRLEGCARTAPPRTRTSHFVAGDRLAACREVVHPRRCPTDEVEQRRASSGCGSAARSRRSRHASRSQLRRRSAAARILVGKSLPGAPKSHAVRTVHAPLVRPRTRTGRRARQRACSRHRR